MTLRDKLWDFAERASRHLHKHLVMDERHEMVRRLEGHLHAMYAATPGEEAFTKAAIDMAKTVEVILAPLQMFMDSTRLTEVLATLRRAPDSENVLVRGKDLRAMVLRCENYENAVAHFSEEMARLENELASIRAVGLEHTTPVDPTHSERNHLVVLVAHMAELLGWNAGVGTHEGEPVPNFPYVVRVQLPLGQVSWHIHETQAYWLQSLGSYVGGWDQISRDDVYKRVRGSYELLAAARRG